MQIRKIKISGFRGIRGTLEIPFGTGFTVITGHNGSGKSSVCDALEYLFTQKITRVSADQAEGRERLEDYIWWRGKRPAKEHTVTGSFTNSAKEDVTWDVTRDGPRGEIPQEFFFHREIAPRNPFSILCQTSIFRDELITWFSTDLAEGPRAEFVEQAIGIIGTAQFEKVAGDYDHFFGERLRNIEGRYDSHRERIAGLVEEISEAKSQAMAAEEESVTEWTQTACRLTGTKSADIGKLLSGVAAKIAETRRRMDQLERLRIDLSAHSEEISEAGSLRQQQESLRAEISGLEGRLKVAEGQLKAASADLKTASEGEPTYTSLAELREHGLRLGLQDGTCPLCGTKLTKEIYDKHLETIAHEIALHESGLGALVKKESDLQRMVAQLRTSVETKRNQFNRIAASFQVFKKTESDIKQRATLARVTLSEDEITSALAIEKANVEELETCADALVGFVASQRVKELEKKKLLPRSKQRPQKKNPTR